MILKLISCEIFQREMCAAVARSCNTVDLEFLPKGLHDIGSDKMLQRVQETVDRVDPSRYEAVVLGYALCNNGVAGLRARSLPVVIPRAHDCITLFLGSRARYQDYFSSHPGTYYLTSGWIERGSSPTGELSEQSISRKLGIDQSYEELVEQYGEEDAKYLYHEFTKWADNYGRMTYIEMGLEPDGRFEIEARRRAEERNWQFDHVQGEMGMIERLLNGPWDDEEFLVVQPGQIVVAKYDEKVIAARSANESDAESAGPAQA
jgi:hypothetical protein